MSPNINTGGNVNDFSELSAVGGLRCSSTSVLVEQVVWRYLCEENQKMVLLTVIAIMKLHVWCASFILQPWAVTEGRY